MATKKRCPACGSTNVEVETPNEYRYKHSGISGLKLFGNGVTITHCGECDDIITQIHDEQQLLQAIGLFLLLTPPGMKGEHLRYLRTLYGMTQAEMAQVMKGPRRETIADWESKGRIFTDPRDEVFPRLILINLFKEKVVDSEYCFLSSEHLTVYRDYVCSFVGIIASTMHHSQKSKPLKLKHHPGKNAWSSDQRGIPA